MLNLDGAPVDRELLGRMTGFLAFRGPDAQATWAGGPVGFGHALLRTTFESEHERQPYSLDGAVWVTADARLDDRQTLIDKLAGHGRQVAPAVPDVELVLHAYHAWGEGCVEHLLGDFAFAVWDGRARRLFCARDHFGVKPFFYALPGGCFVFSNTLNCVRLHPAVSTKLNDLAIADFLVFNRNQDVATTAFADVLRLPPAHTLTCSAGGVRLARYWSLPVDGDIRYRRQGEYVEHLRDLLRRAVGDRLRTRRVGVLMSGGMDSSAVAAAARRLVPAGPGRLELQAFTVVFDSLIADEERYYVGLAAEMLDIPVHFLSADGYRLYDGWDRPELHTPEPCHWPCMLTHHDLLRRIANHGRVALTGQGADPAMHGSASYALSLVMRGAWSRLAIDLGHSLWRGRVPKVGFRARLRRWLGRGHRPMSLPAWISPDLVARLDLATRCRQLSGERVAEHARRPEAWRELTRPLWPYILEDCDPGVTGLPVEFRHPFFDLRVLTWLLAIPPLPWCDQKEVLRSAMAGLLPVPLRRRPKAACSAQASISALRPLAVPRGDRLKASVGVDPTRELLRREESAWVDRFEAAPELAEYVVRARVPPVFGETNARAIWINLRPLSLNYWLPRRNDFLACAGAWRGNEAIRAPTPGTVSVESVEGMRR
jgi:asparagine synthase (glutamine-hydrolysing)